MYGQSFTVLFLDLSIVIAYAAIKYVCFLLIFSYADGRINNFNLPLLFSRYFLAIATISCNANYLGRT
jgi:hypothetical protein